MEFQNGFYDIPAEKLATIVTSLEMKSKPDLLPREDKPDWTLTHMQNPGVDWYQKLYRQIGQEWLWFSRVVMPHDELASIISDPLVEIRALYIDGKPEGLLELDYRNDNECELAFLGVTEKLLGKGSGKWLMNHAIELAWDDSISRPINRLWIHTCTLDHPRALPFYIKSGFKAYSRQLEIAEDPRITGVFPPDTAAYFPVI